jgi:hypothetical protein
MTCSKRLGNRRLLKAQIVPSLSEMGRNRHKFTRQCSARRQTLWGRRVVCCACNQGQCCKGPEALSEDIRAAPSDKRISLILHPPPHVVHFPGAESPPFYLQVLFFSAMETWRCVPCGSPGAIYFHIFNTLAQRPKTIILIPRMALFVSIFLLRSLILRSSHDALYYICFCVPFWAGTSLRACEYT